MENAILVEEDIPEEGANYSHEIGQDDDVVVLSERSSAPNLLHTPVSVFIPEVTSVPLRATSMNIPIPTPRAAATISSYSDDYVASNIPKRKRADSVEENESEAMTCSICMESWTTNGEHRLVCLKCGHLFGKKCIDKWLEYNKKCPQCQQKAEKKDLRFIFTSLISAVDNSAAEQMKKLFEEERARRISLEDENRRMAIQQRSMKAQLDRVTIENRKLRELQQMHSSLRNAVTANSDPTEYLFNTTTLAKIATNECRLIKFLNTQDSGSYPSILCLDHILVPGSFTRAFGYKRVSLADTSIVETVILSQAETKDISVSPLSPGSSSELLLSVHPDINMVRLTQSANGNRVQEIVLPNNIRPWACCWSSKDSYEYFVGGSKGEILFFDLRKSLAPVKVYSTSSTPPIWALAHTKKESNFNYVLAGGPARYVDVHKIDCSEGQQDSLAGKPINLASRRGCLSLAQCSDFTLASFRNSQDKGAEHRLYSFIPNSADPDAMFQEISTIPWAQQSTFSTRCCLFSDWRTDNADVLAGCPNGRRTEIIHPRSGSCLQMLPDLPNDVLSVAVSDDTLASCCLNEVHVYKNFKKQ